MQKNLYRAAIIGAGRMGGLLEDEQPPNTFRKPHGHFAAYAAIEQTEVVAVAGRSQGRLQMFTERFGITNTYLDYREMIVRERPDIVSVTTQAAQRAEPIIFAAEHGVRGIYAEKALCASLAEADRIAAACKANDVAFNFGAERRYHDAYVQLRQAIVRGDIGDPQFALTYWCTDLMKHHSHSFDTVAMLLGDPVPQWTAGRLVEPGDPLDPGDTRMGPREGTELSRRPLPLPTYDPQGHRFVPPPPLEIAEPILEFARVGYAGGAEAIFVPRQGPTEFEVHGSEGRVCAWDDGTDFRVRRKGHSGSGAEEETIQPRGESPTLVIIREIIRELESAEHTSGNIDRTLQVAEAEFGVAYSHLQGGERISLPVEDRSLYIPGH